MRFTINVYVVYATLLLGMVSGCQSSRIYTESVGVFTKKEYVKINNLRWEGGIDNIEKTIICSKLSDFCVEDVLLSIIDIPGDLIAIVMPGKNGNYTIYNQFTGLPLGCRNCKDFLLSDVLKRDNLRWAKNGSFAVGFHSEKYSNKYNIFILNVDNNKAEISYLPTHDLIGQSASKLYSLTLSPEDGVMAWFFCDDKCTLWRFDIMNEELIEQELGCENSPFLEMIWVGAVPQCHFSLFK